MKGKFSVSKKVKEAIIKFENDNKGANKTISTKHSK
jgi:hypothetical protein